MASADTQAPPLALRQTPPLRDGENLFNWLPAHRRALRPGPDFHVPTGAPAVRIQAIVRPFTCILLNIREEINHLGHKSRR